MADYQQKHWLGSRELLERIGGEDAVDQNLIGGMTRPEYDSLVDKLGDDFLDAIVNVNRGLPLTQRVIEAFSAHCVKHPCRCERNSECECSAWWLKSGDGVEEALAKFTDLHGSGYRPGPPRKRRKEVIDLTGDEGGVIDLTLNETE